MTIIYSEGGDYMSRMVKATDALCLDGKRRNAYPTPRGEITGLADTFFSIPAFVYVGKTRVYGYVGHDDEGTYFRAYTYRKNHALIRSIA